MRQVSIQFAQFGGYEYPAFGHAELARGKAGVPVPANDAAASAGILLKRRKSAHRRGT